VDTILTSIIPKHTFHNLHNVILMLGVSFLLLRKLGMTLNGSRLQVVIGGKIKIGPWINEH
jgi:hypothetical protein